MPVGGTVEVMDAVEGEEDMADDLVVDMGEEAAVDMEEAEGEEAITTMTDVEADKMQEWFDALMVPKWKFMLLTNSTIDNGTYCQMQKEIVS
jgi:hypothetical protein